jgi:hypothetical protein
MSFKIPSFKQFLAEESSAWLQIKITFKDSNLEGWQEFFDKDFPALSLRKFESILKDCGVSDLKTFFKKHKTPGSFIASPEGGAFVQQIKNFSDISDVDELIRVITDKYSRK